MTSYTMVRFRKPGLIGETWYVSVSKWGGGPHTANGIDLSIPARFSVSVTQHKTGRYAVYTLFEAEKFVKLKKIDDFPKTVMKELYKKGEAFAKKHGFVKKEVGR